MESSKRIRVILRKVVSMAENKKDVMDEELKKENKAAEAESKAAENT